MIRYTRAERLAQITALLAEGLTHQKIADALGMSRGGVRNILNDPDGSKQRARRVRYQGVCEVCGGPTTGCDGMAKAPRRCAEHPDWDAQVAARGFRRWTRERVIAAAQEFTRRYGRKPFATDWNPPYARATGHSEKADRFVADGCWPHVNTVTDVFGSWNEMIAAAGLPTNAPGQYVRGCGREEASL